MAHSDERVPENVAGDWFVDRSCIDCSTCTWVAPSVFAAARDWSYVAKQPATDEERRRAAMALVACPTSSIGTRDKAAVREASRAFPDPVADNVYFCGYTAESSFGAWSYLIRRDGGNVLIDSPRFARPLVERVAELGGVATMFLTHRDDVADHADWHARFGATRLLHRDDLSPSTRDIERPFAGRDPIRLDDELVIVPVPGHTRGSAVLLYRDEFLFTGDHLWWSESQGRLSASRSVCWYSWPEQKESLARLRELRFRWVLPGHGARFHAATADAMRAELDRMLAALR